MRDDLSAEEMRAWAPPEPSAPATDPRLSGYSGFQLVAQGGEGAVYRARQDGLGRDVAIKALQAVDPATQARFRRELEITVRLGRQHPHIVTVLDTGTLPDGRPCIVMEFYDLGSLHDRLGTHGPLPVADVVAAGIAVADALAFAHGQGILHRDVKPQNVLVLPTSYVLADFGIARGADAGHSASLQMVSYRHAAPQMIDGAAPASADDLWSLGSTLFTLLTGVPPFAGNTPDEDTVLPYLDRVRSADPRPLTRSDVPPALTDVIARCLTKRREDRFPDATSLRDALVSVAADLRHWQPPVDPDATAVRPGATPSVPATDPTPDFGPMPTPPVEEPKPEPQPPAPEPRGTMTGRLADLTVRHAEPEPPDFGPGAAEPPSTSNPLEPQNKPSPEGKTGQATPTKPTSHVSYPQAKNRCGDAHLTSDNLAAGGRISRLGADAADTGPQPSHQPALPDGGVFTPVADIPLPATDNTAIKPNRGAIDPPTEPQLAPTQFDGLPAAHEWEYDTAPDAAAPETAGIRWRGFAIAGVVAAVVGAGIGVLASRDGVPATQPTTTAPPTTATIPPGGDPAVAPVLTKVDDRGGSAELSWQDPTDGRAQFVLYDVTEPGAAPQAITSIAAGLTSFVVTGLDPKAPEYCFQLVAIGLDDPSTQRGASDRLCVSR